MVEWRAYLLRPDTPPEGRPFPYPPEQYAQMSAHMKQMASEAGLTVVDHDWLPSSRLALEAAEFARERGQHDAFHHAVFDAYWAEGRDIGSLDVLRELAAQVGLDPDALAADLQAGTWRGRIDEDVEIARQIGITGVPCFIVGNQAIMGAQPYAVFEQLMASYGREKQG